jgi:hypothetical protein
VPNTLHADEQIARMQVGGAQGDTGDLEPVDVAAMLDAELLHEAGERAGRGMLRAEDRGDPRTHPTPSSDCGSPLTR